MSNTYPGTLFGGIWTEINNVFLVGAGSSYTVDTTGGSNTHSHSVGETTTGGTSLTTSTIPAHTHGQVTISGIAPFRDVNNTGHDMLRAASGILSRSNTDWSGTHRAQQMTNINNPIDNILNISVTHTHTSQGSGSAHTHSQVATTTYDGINTPPYIVAYMWRRTG